MMLLRASSFTFEGGLGGFDFSSILESDAETREMGVTTSVMNEKTKTTIPIEKQNRIGDIFLFINP